MKHASPHDKTFPLRLATLTEWLQIRKINIIFELIHAPCTQRASKVQTMSRTIALTFNQCPTTQTADVPKYV